MVREQQPARGGWVTYLHARGSTRGLGVGGAMGSDKFAQEREQAGLGDRSEREEETVWGGVG
jgi:hypothetical protein